MTAENLKREAKPSEPIQQNASPSANSNTEKRLPDVPKPSIPIYGTVKRGL